MTEEAPQSTVARTGSGDRQVEFGILLMVIGMLLIPGIDAIAKFLSDSVPPGQVAWSRFLFQSLYLLPFVLLGGGPRSNRALGRDLGLQALRGMLIALATLFFFWGLKYLPLADAISIFFVEPLILTLLAAVILKEPVGWRRLGAVALGFVGALIVIRPSFQVFGWPAVLPLCAAGCFAFYLLLTRRLARSGDAIAMQFLSGIFGGLTLSLALGIGAAGSLAVIDPVWPTVSEWLLMALLGLIATSGHMFVVHAFRRASPSILAPFQYLEIITATLLGLLVFGDFPEPLTWLGVAIIIASGLYVFQRERRLRRQAEQAG